MRSPVLLIAAAVILAASGVRLSGLIEYAWRSAEPDDPVTDVIHVLRSDLARGSVFYREGPISDAANESAALPFGDTDDQLAILIAAEPGQPFTTTIPWGVLEAARANLSGAEYLPPDDYDPSAPRKITRETAEVRYSTTPPDSLGTPADSAGTPAGSAGDRTTPRGLWRRVFLFRPGLSVTAASLASAGHPHEGFSALAADQPVLGFLREDGVIEPYRPADTPASDPATVTEADVTLLAETVRLADRVLAFDLQRFDPDVPIFIHAGADGEPGAAGFDDDGNGIFDHPPDRPGDKDRGEFGAVGSDDQTVSPADGAIYKLCRRGTVPAIVIARGSYRDDFAATVGEPLCVSADEPAESPDPLRIVIRYLEAETETPRQAELLGP